MAGEIKFIDRAAESTEVRKILHPVVEEWFFGNQAFAFACAAVRTHFAQEAGLTVIQFKTILGLSRKEAVLLLELMDQHGLTFRQGEARMLRHELE